MTATTLPPTTTPQNPPASPTPPPPLPLTSPLRTHPKRLLPPTLSSTHPHGPLSGHPRSPTSQTRFDARVAEIINTMSVQEIERRYESVAERVREVFEEGERRRAEVEEGRERLVMEREMERRVWGKLRGMK